MVLVSIMCLRRRGNSSNTNGKISNGKIIEDMVGQHLNHQYKKVNRHYSGLPYHAICSRNLDPKGEHPQKNRRL